MGREIAITLAKKGTSVLLHYNTSKAEAQAVQSEIKSAGGDCRLFQADLAKPIEIQRMIKEIFDSVSAVDILVNNASAFYKTLIGTTQESDWDYLMDVNLKAPFLLSREIGCRMTHDRGGKIINIADWSGFRPYKNYAPYCVSKGGLITLTKALARDLAPKVYANAVAPGPVLLPEDFTDEEKEKAIGKTLLRRAGSPQDVANAVVFLAESDFINGTVLTVDGGRSIN